MRVKPSSPTAPAAPTLQRPQPAAPAAHSLQPCARKAAPSAQRSERPFLGANPSRHGTEEGSPCTHPAARNSPTHSRTTAVMPQLLALNPLARPSHPLSTYSAPTLRHANVSAPTPCCRQHLTQWPPGVTRHSTHQVQAHSQCTYGMLPPARAHECGIVAPVSYTTCPPLNSTPAPALPPSVACVCSSLGSSIMVCAYCPCSHIP